MTVVGPLFGSEVRRLSRRGQFFWHRVAIASLMASALLIVYVAWFPRLRFSNLFTIRAIMSPTELQATFAFVGWIKTVQFLAVFLLTPVFVGGGMAEEVERRTVEYLFAAPLSDREIVLGKLFARLAFVFAILLAGTPVLMTSYFFGGLPPSVLFQFHALLFSLAFAIGSFTLYIGSRRGRGIRATLLLSYCFVFLAVVGSAWVSVQWFAKPIPVASWPSNLLILFRLGYVEPLSPIQQFLALFGDPVEAEEVTLRAVLSYCLIGVVFAILTTIGLRRRALAERNLPAIEETPKTEPPSKSKPPRPRGSREPLDEDRPFLWKERFASRIPDAKTRMEHLRFVGCFILGLLYFSSPLWPGHSIISGSANEVWLHVGFAVLCLVLQP